MIGSDIAPFVHYAERQENALLIDRLLKVTPDSGYALLDKLRNEVKSWSEITPYSFESIWYPAWERAKTLMFFGEWNYDVWAKHVADIVHGFKMRSVWSFNLQELWLQTELIEFQNTD